MPIGTLENIAPTYQKGTRLLGMDLGTKTIGLAVSNSQLSIASPLHTIKRTKFTRDIQDIAAVIKDYQIGAFVLGLPLNMDGSEGPKCQAVRHFADEMCNHPDIFGDDPWIGLWDERLSTVSVEDFLIESVDMSRTKRKQVVDKLAAQHILQGAMDYLARH